MDAKQTRHHSQFSKTGLTGLALVALLAGFQAGATAVSGTVSLTGAAPAFPAPKLDPVCTSKNPTPKSETYVTGTGNTLGNVVVYVKSGLPAGKTFPAPKTAVTFDQHGCQYVPHVVGAMVGQPVDIMNSDGITHNVHGLGKKNATFNAAMPGARKKMTKTFDKEEIFEVKCDVHPWMKARMAVFSHPHFAVTGTDGKFTLNLDPGTYEIEAWHEKAGTQMSKVTIAAADAGKTVDFKFNPVK